MNELNFLPKNEEYKVFSKIYGELPTKGKPDEIALNSRKLLEEAIRFIYQKECVAYPISATLLVSNVQVEFPTSSLLTIK